MSFRPSLGVALTGHRLRWDQSVALGRLADRTRIELVIVDGDESRVPARPSAALYDGSSLRSAVLHATQRMHVASIQLPGFQHPVTAARSLATQQLVSGGRVVCFAGIGSGRHLADLGLPPWTLRATDRLRALEESIDLLRQLWRGTPVHYEGTFHRLEGITCPRPESPIPICIAAARPHAVALADRVADFLDANVPPLARFLDPIHSRLTSLRAPWIWVFARPHMALDAAIAEYRRLCPWFPELSRTDYAAALLHGDPDQWPERTRAMRRELDLGCIILDLIGLAPADAERALSPWADTSP